MCLLMTFCPSVQHFQVSTKCQALYEAPEMQRWLAGDAQSLVGMNIRSEIKISVIGIIREVYAGRRREREELSKWVTLVFLDLWVSTLTAY